MSSAPSKCTCLTQKTMRCGTASSVVVVPLDAAPIAATALATFSPWVSSINRREAPAGVS